VDENYIRTIPLKPELDVFSIFDCAFKELITADLNESSPVCLFPTPKGTI